MTYLRRNGIGDIAWRGWGSEHLMEGNDLGTSVDSHNLIK